MAETNNETFDVEEIDAPSYILDGNAIIDPSRLVLHDPITISFDIGSTKIEETNSRGMYLDDEGNEAKLYILGPPQTCFGPSYQHDINIAEDDRTPSNAKGMQIQYPMTSLQSISSPSPAEQAFQETIDTIWQFALEKGQEEITQKPLRIPAVSRNSFIAARETETWTDALKPAYAYKKLAGSKNKDAVDTTKPSSMYVKLVTKGREKKLRVLTPFYGPGDIKESPVKYINTRGTLTPCLEWVGVRWGAHGKNPHGASLVFRIVEANYTPSRGDDDMPKKRILNSNTSKRLPEDDDDTASNAAPEETDQEPEEGTFASPGTSASAALNRALAAKKLAAKAPGKAVAKGKAPAKGKVVTPAKAPAKGKTVTPAKAPAKGKVIKPKPVPEPEYEEPEPEYEEPEPEDEGVVEDAAEDVDENGEEVYE